MATQLLTSPKEAAKAFEMSTRPWTHSRSVQRDLACTGDAKVIPLPIDELNGGSPRTARFADGSGMFWFHLPSILTCPYKQRPPST